MRIETHVVGAGPGSWRERNAVLEETDADVVAFLDHDIAPAADWEERLHELWEAAEPAVAAIGGPIAPAFPAGEPAWFGPAAASRLALQDLGGERRELDPSRESLHGGNLSFRVWQLAAIGGLKPSFDGRGGRGFFSEEHEAQRELGRWGWRVVYAPELRVERRLEPARGEVVRAAWRNGARLGRLGRRERGASAKQAATSLAGLPPALARRRPALVMERAARLAESAAAALARRVPEEQPDPPVVRRLRRRGAARPSAAILLYHRVADRRPDPLGLCVHPDRFEEQLAVLAQRQVIPLAELAAAVRAGDVPAGALAVTFDDGYADNLHAALPRLRAAGIPATVFAATGHIEQGRGFFWDEVTRLLEEAPAPVLEVDIGGERRRWPAAAPDERARARYELHHLLQPRSPEVVEAALAQLRGWAGVDDGMDEADRPLTPAELRALAEGVAIGAHTRAHVSLRFQPAERQRAEIEGSRDDVERWTGARPAGFSYPFGIPGRDFVPRTAALVREAGFGHAVGNAPGPVDATTDLFALPRWVVPDAGADHFERWLVATVGAPWR